MRLCELMTLGRGSFGLRIFYALALFLFVIYFSFTAFFVYYENENLKREDVIRGRQIANLLANSVRLGVLTETANLLRSPVEEILQNRDVGLIQIFTQDGSLLLTERNPHKTAGGLPVEILRRMNTEAMDEIRKNGALDYLIGSDWIEFWSPVVSKEISNEEDLFFSEDADHKDTVVTGFVRIMIHTERLKVGLAGLLSRGAIIPALLLIPAWAIAYCIVRRFTRPLESLTEQAVALGQGKAIRKIHTGTDDEIGKLAEAFDNMSDALKRREKEKQEIEEQLRHSQKLEAMGTFAGGIAHDFNNILNAITGYAELLQKKSDDEKLARRCIEQILNAASKGENLTGGLLAYTRKQVIFPRRVDINAVITDMKDILERLLSGDITFKVLLTDEVLKVKADPGQLQQVLMNLVANARDAMPEGGHIVIQTGRKSRAALQREGRLSPEGRDKDGGPAEYAEISVSDTGAGMDKATIEKIFDPFFTTKKSGRGTGLGLSIVYGIISQHNGMIDISSEPGRGSAFSILLPLSDAAVEEGLEEAVLPEVRGGTETILLADDDGAVREFMAILLERNGYRVIEAADGRDAVDKFVRFRDEIQLLVLDMSMPEKNGVQVYEEVRGIDPEIKAVFISGYPDDIIDRDRFLEKGVTLLVKPVASEKLLRTVRDELDGG